MLYCCTQVDETLMTTRWPSAYHIFNGDWVDERYMKVEPLKHLVQVDGIVDEKLCDFYTFTCGKPDLPLIDVWCFSKVEVIQMIYDRGAEDSAIISHNKTVYEAHYYDQPWNHLSCNWTTEVRAPLVKKQKGILPLVNPPVQVPPTRGKGWYVHMHAGHESPPLGYAFFIGSFRRDTYTILSAFLEFGKEAPHMSGIFLSNAFVFKCAPLMKLITLMGEELWGVEYWPRWVALNLFGDWHTEPMQDERFHGIAPMWWRFPEATYLTTFVISGKLKLKSDIETDPTPYVCDGEILITMGNTYVNLAGENYHGLVTLTFAH